MLRESIRWCNRERVQAARIYELGRCDPPAIRGVDMRNIMEGEQYIFNKEEKYQKLTEILDRCEADWRAGRGPQRRPLRPGGGHHRRVED